MRRARLLLLAAGMGLGPGAALSNAAASATAASAASAAAALHCQLSGAAQVAAGQPVLLQLVLHNRGTQPVDLLVWGTPFEARWFAPYVAVQRNGSELAYRGALVKRGDPSPANYLRLDAGQSKHASIELSAAFDLAAPGRYRVLPRIVLQDLVVGAGAGVARPRDQHTSAALDCPALDFDVLR